MTHRRKVANSTRLEKLLFVDPDPLFQEKMKGFLSGRFNIDFVSGVREAQGNIASNDYDCMSIELFLPFDEHTISDDEDAFRHGASLAADARRVGLYVIGLTCKINSPLILTRDKSDIYIVYNKQAIDANVNNYIRDLQEHRLE